MQADNLNLSNQLSFGSPHTYIRECPSRCPPQVKAAQVRGYLIGSLAKPSIDRKLAKALIRLGLSEILCLSRLH
jgi:hypothetical protein